MLVEKADDYDPGGIDPKELRRPQKIRPVAKL
jgi:hypothetical protein